MLATIEAMAEADAVRGARGGEAHVTAQAATLDFTGHSSSSLFPTLGFGAHACFRVPERLPTYCRPKSKGDTFKCQVNSNQVIANKCLFSIEV